MAMTSKQISDISSSLLKKLDVTALSKKLNLASVRKGQYNIGTAEASSANGDTAVDVILTKSEALSNDSEKLFKTWNDDCVLTALLVAKRGQPIESIVPMLKIFQTNRDIFAKQTELQKAMDTTTAGAGLEWIPTNFSSQIIEKFELQKKVAAMHTTITMPTDPFKLPAINAFAQAKLATEGVAPTTTTIGTANVTLDAQKLMVDLPFTSELEEDAAVAILPLVRDAIANGLARALENATINGDDSGTHQDVDVTDGEDPRKAWKGYRKLALPAATVDLGTFDYETLVSVKTAMGIFGVDPADLFWITGPVGHGKLLTVKDSSGNTVLISLDKMGPNAPLVKGSVGSFLGSDVIISEFIREDLAADGFFDGVTTSKTIILLVKKAGFLYGNKRSIMVEQDRDISKQENNLVSSMRTAFIDQLDAANNTLVGVGRNIA